VESPQVIIGDAVTVDKVAVDSTPGPVNGGDRAGAIVGASDGPTGKEGIKDSESEGVDASASGTVGKDKIEEDSAQEGADCEGGAAAAAATADGMEMGAEIGGTGSWIAISGVADVAGAAGPAMLMASTSIGSGSGS
jgi:hypothetical protein